MTIEQKKNLNYDQSQRIALALRQEEQKRNEQRFLNFSTPYLDINSEQQRYLLSSDTDTESQIILDDAQRKTLKQINEELTWLKACLTPRIGHSKRLLSNEEKEKISNFEQHPITLAISTIPTLLGTGALIGGAAVSIAVVPVLGVIAFGMVAMSPLAIAIGTIGLLAGLYAIKAAHNLLTAVFSHAVRTKGTKRIRARIKQLESQKKTLLQKKSCLTRPNSQSHQQTPKTNKRVKLETSSNPKSFFNVVDQQRKHAANRVGKVVRFNLNPTIVG
jgi:hypothetical protein